MASSTFVIQSIVYDAGRVHITWMDPASEGPVGLELTVSVIDLSAPELAVHLAELYDDVLQLVTEFGAVQRQAGAVQRQPRTG